MRGKLGLAALLAFFLTACGGGGGAGGSGGEGGVPDNTVSAPAPTPTDEGAVCTATTTFMGKSTLLIGAQMSDATAKAAPFDARYLYLAGGIRPAGSCASSCSAACGNWWGCWQDWNQAPGQYVRSHIQNAAGATWQGAARPQIPAITYYELLHSAGTADGTDEVPAINDAALLTRYFNDWRFLLQKVDSNQAILHIEPDFWGYVRAVNSNPHLVPAKVTSANPTDCATQENSASGFAKCMIAMVRKYAPNARVGLHASPWLIGMNGDGAATGAFMLALGAADGDFVVTDPSDRDAGYYESIGRNTWWDNTAAANFLAWSKAVSLAVGRPMVMWQIPLGNMAQNNTPDHWQDNRVDYLFAHLTDVSKSRIVALLFGAGASQQTSPESDGGNLIAKTTANWQAGGAALCQ